MKRSEKQLSSKGSFAIFFKLIDNLILNDNLVSKALDFLEFLKKLSLKGSGTSRINKSVSRDDQFQNFETNSSFDNK